jgi:hypothetical protein
MRRRISRCNSPLALRRSEAGPMIALARHQVSQATCLDCPHPPFGHLLPLFAGEGSRGEGLRAWRAPGSSHLNRALTLSPSHSLASRSNALIRPSATFSRHREKGLGWRVFAPAHPLIRPSATFSRHREKGLDWRSSGTAGVESPSACECPPQLTAPRSAPLPFVRRSSLSCAR